MEFQLEKTQSRKNGEKRREEGRKKIQGQARWDDGGSFFDHFRIDILYLNLFHYFIIKFFQAVNKLWSKDIFFILPIPVLGQKKILKGEMGRVIDKKLDEKIQKQQDEIHELQNIINDLRGVNREVRNFIYRTFNETHYRLN